MTEVDTPTPTDPGPDQLPSVVHALNQVKAEVRAVRKSERNPQQGYQFRGIDSVVNAVSGALTRHGVIVAPITQSAEWRDVQTSTGKPSRECTVSVRYRWYGPAGDYIDAVVPGESMDFGDKGAPKAMSVAYRIALLQTLTLPTDEPDPDAATFERATGNPATKVLAALRKTCQDNGFDMNVVADRFVRDHGVGLRECTDPEQIEKFRQSLYALPTHELRPAAPDGEEAPE